jgi:hypothetical protein
MPAHSFGRGPVKPLAASVTSVTVDHAPYSGGSVPDSRFILGGGRRRGEWGVGGGGRGLGSGGSLQPSLNRPIQIATHTPTLHPPPPPNHPALPRVHPPAHSSQNSLIAAQVPHEGGSVPARRLSYSDSCSTDDAQPGPSSGGSVPVSWLRLRGVAGAEGGGEGVAAIGGCEGGRGRGCAAAGRHASAQDAAVSECGAGVFAARARRGATHSR